MQPPSNALINILKVLPFRFQQSVDPFAMLFFEESSDTRLFKHLSNRIFWSRYFRKDISYDGHVFLANVQNLLEILKMPKKIHKNSLFLR